VVSVARIEVHGNGINIPPVVNVPNVADNTDFGQTSIGNPIIKTFWIVNPGESPLTLTGTPPVTVTGNGFSVVSQPSPTVVPAGDSVSFQLQFNPTQFGLVNGQVFIAHSDSYSVCNTLNPFYFNVQGDVINTPPTIPNPPADTFVCINSAAIQFSFLVQDSEQQQSRLNSPGQPCFWRFWGQSNPNCKSCCRANRNNHHYSNGERQSASQQHQHLHLYHYRWRPIATRGGVSKCDCEFKQQQPSRFNHAND
jgi:hypothetical protein